MLGSLYWWWWRRRSKAPFVPPRDTTFRFTRTLDRTFTDTPASGGGNVDPQTFVYEEQDWELWQVIPYLGTAVVGASGRGDARIQLRNRDVNRGSMQLTDMPSRIVIEQDGWTGSPWTFRRPTAGNKFSNVASGQSARKGIDYEPLREVGASAAAEGIAQGQEFTVTLHWD